MVVLDHRNEPGFAPASSSSDPGLVPSGAEQTVILRFANEDARVSAPMLINAHASFAGDNIVKASTESSGELVV